MLNMPWVSCPLQKVKISAVGIVPRRILSKETATNLLSNPPLHLTESKT